MEPFCLTQTPPELSEVLTVQPSFWIDQQQLCAEQFGGHNGMWGCSLQLASVGVHYINQGWDHETNPIAISTERHIMQ